MERAYGRSCLGRNTADVLRASGVWDKLVFEEAIDGCEAVASSPADVISRYNGKANIWRYI